MGGGGGGGYTLHFRSIQTNKGLDPYIVNFSLCNLVNLKNSQLLGR